MGGDTEISSLDEAYGLRTAGEREAALRLAVALLEGSPEQLGAASLCAFILAESEREEIAGEAAKRLADAFVRRGDLPAAIVATRIADAAGEDGGALRERIAQAFGKGSSRLATKAAPAPPPLPKSA